jgi:hypothetical protein
MTLAQDAFDRAGDSARCNNDVRKLGIDKMTNTGLEAWTRDINKCVKQIDLERVWLLREKKRLNIVLREIRDEQARRRATNGEP